MKVIQVPFTFHPDPVGGTEIYVAALARCLSVHRIESVIAAPGERSVTYDHSGTRVHRYVVCDDGRDLRVRYGEGDQAAAAAFGRILDDERPDLVHLHALTSGVSLSVLRQARKRGLPVLFTYHTPTVTCQRSTLLRWGTEVCDGQMNERLCTACLLHGCGLSRPLAQLFATLPTALSAAPGRIGFHGALWTGWRMRELTELRHRTTRLFLRETAHIVAVCEWVSDVLRRNGVPKEKITLSHQGVCYALGGQAIRKTARRHTPGDPLKLVFLGRMHPTKGLDVLVHALRSAPESNVTLDIFGVGQGAEGDNYRRAIQRMVAGDQRIMFKPPMPADKVVEVLSDYDLLAVPSQWLESGPMVVLEAFAAGIPVLGSRLGGLMEIIRDGIDGILVEPTSISAWASAIRDIAGDRARLAALHASILPPRTIATVADEMAELYRRVQQKTRATGVAS